MNWKKILIGEWSWKRPFITLAWVYGILLIVALFFSNSLIFHPPQTPYPANRDHFITLQSDDATPIAAYFRPADPGKVTLLWTHGNAESLASVNNAMDGLSQMGFGVMAYDFPGYGESPGKPNEDECYRAINSAYRYLVDDQKIPPRQIVLAGQSVGSGPTCWLASKEEHGGVLLISPFLSAFRTITKIPLFPGDKFQNIRRIRDFSTPLLIIHGEDDEVIPFAQGKKLFDLSNSSQKTFLPIPNAGHNNLFVREPFLIFDAFETFGRTVLPMSLSPDQESPTQTP